MPRREGCKGTSRQSLVLIVGFDWGRRGRRRRRGRRYGDTGVATGSVTNGSRLNLLLPGSSGLLPLAVDLGPQS